MLRMALLASKISVRLATAAKMQKQKHWLSQGIYWWLWGLTTRALLRAWSWLGNSIWCLHIACAKLIRNLSHSHTRLPLPAFYFNKWWSLKLAVLCHWWLESTNSLELRACSLLFPRMSLCFYLIDILRAGSVSVLALNPAYFNAYCTKIQGHSHNWVKTKTLQ